MAAALADCSRSTIKSDMITGADMWQRGTLLDERYRLAERIGGGAMGDVWRADDAVLERPVAVKILLPALLDDPAFATRFRREAQLLAALSHPGIVDIHDYGEAAFASGARVAYIVMELVDGQPLDRVLADRGPMPSERVCGVVAQALDALHAAHRQNIVHRDIKPSNLMLREDDRVAVTDFGIARAMTGTRITASHEVLGTALYMAPEQAEGIATIPASDLYSMGVVCYEMLTGETPFTGEAVLEVVLKHIRQPAPELPEGFPQPLREFVARALAKKPEDRFRDASAMAAAARRVAAGGSAPAEEPGGRVVSAPPQPERSPGAPGSPAGPGVPAVPAVSDGDGDGDDDGEATRSTEPEPEPVREPEPSPAPELDDTPAPKAPAPDLVKEPAPEPAKAPGPEPVTAVPAERRRRSRLLIPLLVPCVIVVTAGTVLLIEPAPYRSNASAAGPQQTVSASASSPVSGAAPGGGRAGGPSGKASAGTPTSALGRGGAKSGGVGSAAGGSGGSQGAGGSNGSGSGVSGSSGSGSGSGSGGSGSGGHGGGAGGGATAPAAGTAPTTAPGPTTPAGCGGSGWGSLVNVGDGLKVGLSGGSLAGGTAVVMGGDTAYGWVYSTPTQWHAFNPCNLNDPDLGEESSGNYSDQPVELASGYGDVTSWTVKSAPASGSYYIENYLGVTCLTDNGTGRQLTVDTCTPGNASQEWYLP